MGLKILLWTLALRVWGVAEGLAGCKTEGRGQRAEGGGDLVSGNQINQKKLRPDYPQELFKRCLKEVAASCDHLWHS